MYLGALTLTALKHLGENALVVDADNNVCPDWQMARLDNIVLFEKPADSQSPKRIDCYYVVERGAGGTAFKLDRSSAPGVFAPVETQRTPAGFRAGR